MTTRRATPDDAEAMAALINEIIAIGGTTAIETPFTRDSMNREFVSGPHVISCIVAEESGDLLGFQILLGSTEEEPMPDGWGSIGTYARVGRTGGGVGSVLFAETLKAARSSGLHAIDATIRADNTGGLTFYSRMGFVDYDRRVGVPLKDGTLVDRVRKRYDLS
ncbi:MAG TPA: GNAT family N-acetyltransferase [Candidatus Binatia bacterium]|nr:GNAT family N-acetyltransferase [Candidatus Binatia bacterium]